MKKTVFRPTFSQKVLLNKSLSEIVSLLPHVDYVRKLPGEANFYGAASQIAHQTGSLELCAPGARWEHGWKYGAMTTAEHIGGYNKKKRKSLHLVSNQNHESILRAEGFLNVHAVGLPYLYAPKPNLERRKRSLLVCPGHTSTYSDQDWSKVAEEYAGWIAEIQNDFSDVLVCLSANCIEREQWIHEFEAQGIPWVMGAWIHDRNALRRMRILFSQFEFVTTNCVGSHIVYSSFEGCKTSIWGWQDLYKPEGFANEPIYKGKEAFLSESLLWGTQSWMREHYGQLFYSHPKDATSLKEWAAEQLGEPYQRPAKDVANLFAWPRSKDPTLKVIPIDQLVGFSGSLPARFGERFLQFFRGDTRARLEKLNQSEGGLASFEGTVFRYQTVHRLLRVLDRVPALDNWILEHGGAIKKAVFIGGSEIEVICCLRRCAQLDVGYVGSNSIQTELFEANLDRFGYKHIEIVRALPDDVDGYRESPSDTTNTTAGHLLPVLAKTFSLGKWLHAQSADFVYVDLDLTSCQIVESSIASAPSVSCIWMHTNCLDVKDPSLVRLIDYLTVAGFDLSSVRSLANESTGINQNVFCASRADQ